MPAPNTLKSALLQADADLVNDTIRVALFNNTISYTFSVDDHDTVGDVLDGSVAEEFGGSGGSGYSRQTVSSQTVSTDDGGDRGFFTAANLSWSDLDGEEIQGVIIYKQVGGDDTTPNDDQIITVVDDSDAGDLPLPTNGSAVELNWDSNGILEVV